MNSRPVFRPGPGTTIGSIVLGFGLVAIGFDKNNVTPQAVNGIAILMSVIPAALAALCAVVMLIFPLTDKRVLEMHADMAKKGISA